MCPGVRPRVRHSLPDPAGPGKVAASPAPLPAAGYAVPVGFVFFLLLAIVVIAIVGGALLGILLHVVWWAIVGLVIGALARLVIPDDRGTGLLGTILFGIGGALLGGLIAGALDVGWFIEFLIAVLVAAVLIAVFGRGNRPSGSGVTRPR